MGIARQEPFPESDFTLEDAREVTAAFATLGNGKPLPTLVDLRNVRWMQREARAHFSGPETAIVQSAAALIIASPLSRAIGNFFLGFNKPLFPTRLFTSETEALEWLKGFVD